MNARCSRTLLSLFVVPVCWVQALAQEPAQYTVTAGNEEIHYVRSCERGYVVKAAEGGGQIGILAQMLFLEEGRVQPIGGLGRHGVWIVENDGPASRNDAVMAALIEEGAAEYVAPLFSSNGETVAIIPEIVVRVKPGIEMEEVRTLCEKAGSTIKKRMEFTEQEYLLAVLGLDAEAVFAAVEELGQAPEVEWAWPNTAFRPKLAGQGVSSRRVPSRHLGIASAGEDANTAGVFPDDEYFPMQWHLHNTGQSGGTSGADIRAPEAWEITTGDPNIVVAVLDTGVDSKHPDLINNLVPGYDFIDNDDQPDPALDNYGNAHGTACAGLIAAQGNNAIGVTGVTWNCKIMPVRLDIGGAMPTNEADIATAFRWAASQGADILSNSWGFYGPLPIIHSAIVDITKASGIGRNGKGCVLLFAAMNDSGPITGYPQKYPEVITVGATEHSDHRTWYSSYGPELDIAAPSGGGVVVKNLRGQYLEEYARLSTDLLWTTDILGDVGFSIFNENSELLDYTEKMSGTSGATPVAAGVAALILSVEPNLTCDEVRHFLERSAKDLGAPGRDDYYGWGRGRCPRGAGYGLGQAGGSQ